VVVVTSESFAWLLGFLSKIHHRPFPSDLLNRDHLTALKELTLVDAARAFGFVLNETTAIEFNFPTIVELNEEVGLITANHLQGGFVVFWKGRSDSIRATHADLVSCQSGRFWNVTENDFLSNDPDHNFQSKPNPMFGFSWFIPEILRHKRIWKQVIFGALVLQGLTLLSPLFTQAIIDKVIVHRTTSTLVTIGVALCSIAIFTGLLTWARQCLVLEAGNKIDEVLGLSVWGHLLRLPIRYFERRSTGAVSARLQGVETIREFLSSAAICLILDFPFLIICVAVMLYYSVWLTIIALCALFLIGICSVVMAPMFQKCLDEQFILGARNQVFLTEHISGFETVKALQMETHLKWRYSKYLSQYLHASLKSKHIAGNHTVIATTIEQLMTLSILLVGAWLVITNAGFSIGMLVAFLMFSGKLSQPVMRLVGLWAQFQQANLAVARLGDLMNASLEPHDFAALRPLGPGKIEIKEMAFRYKDDLPMLFANVNLAIEAGTTIAINGASGSGKSTLTKLLLGFYSPSCGQLRIDGVDIRNLNANELRTYFGVVPQETILFSGTLFENLIAGRTDSSFDQVVAACKLAAIHTHIEALPKGYQTEIGERGVGLSGGQKQRLAIARALLKQPKVLIFDEATSALDSETAEKFAETINQLKSRVTVIFVTHNRPKALNVDAVWEITKNGLNEVNNMFVAANTAPSLRVTIRAT
jgi:ATP-binding cassette, subfamily B, bacterial HlyB/CyaB